jgi:hypothetical protein
MTITEDDLDEICEVLSHKYTGRLLNAFVRECIKADVANINRELACNNLTKMIRMWIDNDNQCFIDIVEK